MCLFLRCGICLGERIYTLGFPSSNRLPINDPRIVTFAQPIPFQKLPSTRAHPVQSHALIIILLSPPLSNAEAVTRGRRFPSRFSRTCGVLHILVPLEPIPLPRSVHRKTHVRARQRQAKQHKFHEEPCPAAARRCTTAGALARHRARRLTACLCGRLLTAGILFVQVV